MFGNSISNKSPYVISFTTLPLDVEDLFFFHQRCKYFIRIRPSVLADFKKSLCENIAYAVSYNYALCCENSREVL